jgi:hypothetical protein
MVKTKHEKMSTFFFFEFDVLKVLEEPEEYVVEEKMHFISKKVEVEPAKGIPTLKYFNPVFVIPSYI